MRRDFVVQISIFSMPRCLGSESPSRVLAGFHVIVVFLVSDVLVCPELPWSLQQVFSHRGGMDGAGRRTGSTSISWSGWIIVGARLRTLERSWCLWLSSRGATTTGSWPISIGMGMLVKNPGTDNMQTQHRQAGRQADRQTDSILRNLISLFCDQFCTTMTTIANPELIKHHTKHHNNDATTAAAVIKIEFMHMFFFLLLKHCT